MNVYRNKWYWIVLVLLVVFALVVGWGSVKAQEEPTPPGPELTPSKITFYTYYDSNNSGIFDVGDQAAHNYHVWMDVTDNTGATTRLDGNTGPNDYVQFTLDNCTCSWTAYGGDSAITGGTILPGTNRLFLTIVDSVWFLPLLLKQ